MGKIALTVLAIASAWMTGARAESPSSYSVNPEQSKIEIHVSREGFLKVFGHDHLISAKQLSGQVRFATSNVAESSVTFVVETGSLVVLDPGESDKDRKEVQATMLGERVLDAGHYSQIQFASSRVAPVAQKDGVMEIQVQGVLYLHGIEQSVTLPVRIRQDEGKLTADGEFSLRQSDYGITPVKVGAGAVRVKDKLKITFHIVTTERAIVASM